MRPAGETTLPRTGPAEDEPARVRGVSRPFQTSFPGEREQPQ